MTAKHTPGPWNLKNTGFGKYRISDTEGYEFCDVQNDDYEALEADAHLIAAAPDLLEALQRLLGWDVFSGGGHISDDAAFARRVVAKAIGEQP